MKKYIISLPFFKTPDDLFVTGGIISNYYLVSHVSSLGKTTVICPGCNCTQREVNLPVNLITLDIKKTKSVIGTINLFIRNFVEVYRQCNSCIGKYEDVVIVTSTASIPSSYLVAKILNCKCVIITRAYEDFVYGSCSPLKTSILRKVVKKFLNFGLTKKAYQESTVITNSRWMSAMIKQTFDMEKDVQVLYPPLDIEQNDYKLYPVAKNELIDKFKIGFISRGNHKGDNIVLEIAKLIPYFDFNIYGDSSPFLDNINEYSNLNLCGWQSRLDIFSTVHLLIVPSVWPEPLGRVSIEAQYFLTPVLVANTGGLPETITDSRLIVNDLYPETWAKKIMYIANNYDQYVSIVKNKTGQLEKFSLNAHFLNIMDIFSHV